MSSRGACTSASTAASPCPGRATSAGPGRGEDEAVGRKLDLETRCGLGCAPKASRRSDRWATRRAAADVEPHHALVAVARRALDLETSEAWLTVALVRGCACRRPRRAGACGPSPLPDVSWGRPGRPSGGSAASRGSRPASTRTPSEPLGNSSISPRVRRRGAGAEGLHELRRRWRPTL